MSYKQISKRRVATATVALGFVGAGLVAAGSGGGTTSVSAGRAGRPVANMASGAPGDGMVAELELAGGRSGWRFFKNWADQQADQAGGELSRAHRDTQQDMQAADTNGTGSDGNVIPHRVTVSLPTYSGGRAPEVGEPTVDPGTPPSVEAGWQTTVDLGTPPSAQPPSVDQGEPGTMTPPSVETS